MANGIRRSPPPSHNFGAKSQSQPPLWLWTTTKSKVFYLSQQITRTRYISSVNGLYLHLCWVSSWRSWALQAEILKFLTEAAFFPNNTTRTPSSVLTLSRLPHHAVAIYKWPWIDPKAFEAVAQPSERETMSCDLHAQKLPFHSKIPVFFFLLFRNSLYSYIYFT